MHTTTVSLNASLTYLADLERSNLFEKRHIDFNHPLFWDRYHHSFEDTDEVWDITMHALQFIVGVLGLLLNIFYMTIIICTDTLYAQNCASLNISMAMSGVLTCGGILIVDSIIYAYVYTNLLGDVHPSVLSCKIWASYATLACSSSSINIPAIALDRLIAVSRPLHYDWIMTPLSMACLVGSVWVVSLVVASMPLTISHAQVHESLNHTEDTYKTTHPLGLCHVVLEPWLEICLTFLVIFVPAITLTVIYFHIYRVTQEHKKSMFCVKVLGKLIEVSTTHLKKPEDMPAQDLFCLRKVHSPRMQTSSENSLAVKPMVAGSSVDVAWQSRHSLPYASNLSAVSEEVRKFHSRTHSAHSSMAQSAPLSTVPSTQSSVDHSTPSSMVDAEIFFGDSDSEQLGSPLQQSATQVPPSSPLSLAIRTDSNSTAYSSQNQDLDPAPAPVSLAVSASKRKSSTIPRFTGVSSHADMRSEVPKTIRPSLAGKSKEFWTKLQTSPYTSDKAFRVLSLVVGTYLVCWLPLGFITIVSSIWPGIISRKVGDVALWTAYYTSCINPIIYSLYNKPLLYAMKESLCGREWVYNRRSTISSQTSRARLMRTYSYSIKRRQSMATV